MGSIGPMRSGGSAKRLSLPIPTRDPKARTGTASPNTAPATSTKRSASYAERSRRNSRTRAGLGARPSGGDDVNWSESHHAPALENPLDRIPRARDHELHR